MSELVPRKVLALDLSPVVGWCYGAVGCVPLWGALKLPKEAGHGAVCAGFEDWLDQFLENERPDLVSYEAPLAPNLQGDRESCIYNFGLTFACEGSCWRAGVKVTSHSLETLRGAVIGRTKLTPSEKAIRPRVSVKTQIVEPWARSMGWNISEANARDAAVVLAYEHGIRHANFGKRRAA